MLWFFPVVMYRCESWTIKKAESQWIVVLQKTLGSPLDCKEIKPSILKEISPEYSLERLMLKLKLQYFGHLMRRADSLEKTLMLGKIEGRRRRGWQDEMVGWHHRLNGHEFEWTAGDGDGQESLPCCSPRGHKESDTTEWLNWLSISLSYINVPKFLIHVSVVVPYFFSVSVYCK